MDHGTNFPLVKGTFEPEDAHDILSFLFEKKINFHQTRCFEMEERLAICDDFSKKRIEELKQDKYNLEQQIAAARIAGKNVKIRTIVEIEVTEDTPSVSKGKILEPASL